METYRDQYNEIVQMLSQLSEKLDAVNANIDFSREDINKNIKVTADEIVTKITATQKLLYDELETRYDEIEANIRSSMRRNGEIINNDFITMCNEYLMAKDAIEHWGKKEQEDYISKTVCQELGVSQPVIAWGGISEQW